MKEREVGNSMDATERSRLLLDIRATIITLEIINLPVMYSK
jgi:hypothetical protein